MSIPTIKFTFSVPEPLEYKWFVGNLTATDLPGKDISPKGLQITQIVAMCVGMFAMGLTVDLKKMLQILKRPWECVQVNSNYCNHTFINRLSYSSVTHLDYTSFTLYS